VDKDESNRQGAVNAAPTNDARTIIVPVAREEVVVGSTTTEAERVRVRVGFRTRNERIQADAHLEDVEVERIPMEQVVAVPPAVRVEGDTTIIPVLEEVVVVEKRLILKEEIRVRRVRRTEPRAIQVALRAEHVEIERPDSNAGKNKDEAERRTRP